jgi:hypothetical protein
MQFVEFLLWLTNPRNGCTTANKLITLTLIPFVLCLQALCPAIGSFFVKPWAQCNESRRIFIVVYSIVAVLSMLIYFYKNPTKYCTTVTANGHLDWFVSEWPGVVIGTKRLIATTVWLIMIIIPFIVLWDISYKAVIAFCILPLFGYYYGFTTDANGSVWCHFASFTSITSLIMYGLYKCNIYNILK